MLLDDLYLKTQIQEITTDKKLFERTFLSVHDFCTDIMLEYLNSGLDKNINMYITAKHPFLNEHKNIEIENFKISCLDLNYLCWKIISIKLQDKETNQYYSSLTELLKG